MVATTSMTSTLPTAAKRKRLSPACASKAGTSMSATAGPSSSSSSKRRALPRSLPRPTFSAPRRASLDAVEPELADVPASYIRESLLSRGAEMYRAVANTRASSAVPRKPLPAELEITIGCDGVAPPTHLLAVHRRCRDNTPRKLNTPPSMPAKLYPVHALVLAAYCTHLPFLPRGKDCSSSSSAPASRQASPDMTTTTTTTTATLTVPLAPLSLPDGTAFPTLLDYLYHRRPDALVRALLRSRDRRVAAARVHGLWRDACALGVCDEDFWDALDMAWSIILGVHA